METKFPALYILIGGDFNAQLGVQVLPSIEALYSQEIPQAIGHLILARHSKDELTNFAGIQKAVHAFYVDCLTESDHYPLVTIIGLSSNIHLPKGPQILDPYVAFLYNQALTSSGPETILAFESLINSVQRELGADRRPSGPYYSRSNP
ncbi:hypothetical protein E2320_002054 [Naja naja]|nr:hypothetical protein E2320_002054 [Naja naja]